MSNFDDYHLRTHGADAAVDPVERHAFEAADVQPLCLRGNHDAPRPAPPTRGRLLAAADAIEKDDEARHHVECLPFHALSPEGKLTKIRHHLSKSSGVPVPAPWVQWLVEQL